MGIETINELLLTGVLGIALAYITDYTTTRLNRYMAWKEQPGLRLLSGTIFNLAVSLLLVFCVLFAYHKIIDSPLLEAPGANDFFLKIAILLFFIALIYNIIYFVTYSYYQYTKGQLLELQLDRKQTTLQLNALKSQLSPHFLFNNVNILSSLLLEDTVKAEKFIRALANSYQYTLSKYEDRLVAIAEELEFVQSYYLLIKTRFGNHLTLNIDLPETVLNSKIPPLTLQMLVENAVKHNVMGPQHELKMDITTKSGKIVVSNTKTKKRANIDSFKIGLANIATRYELLAHTNIEVLNAERFTVKLPVIT